MDFLPKFTLTPPVVSGPEMSLFSPQGLEGEPGLEGRPGMPASKVRSENVSYK